MLLTRARLSSIPLSVRLEEPVDERFDEPGFDVLVRGDVEGVDG